MFSAVPSSPDPSLYVRQIRISIFKPEDSSFCLNYIQNYPLRADEKQAWWGSPLQGWRSHDAMGFLHLQLAWHLLPSRDQEHWYRQAWSKKTCDGRSEEEPETLQTWSVEDSFTLWSFSLTIHSLYLTAYWDHPLDLWLLTTGPSGYVTWLSARVWMM